MITKKSENLIMTRMADGEDLFANLERVAKKYRMKSGIILGAVGQLKDVELAYYVKDFREYIKKQFSDPFEITNLSGNLSYFEGKLASHIHVVLGNREFGCIGGHLNKATVSATVELFMLTSIKFVRKYDEKTGLNILEFEE